MSGNDGRQMKTIYVNGVIVGEVRETGDLDSDMKTVREFLRTRNLLPPPNPIRAIQGQAIAFANAANAVYERYLRTIPATNGLSAVPFVVNSAFSIELYLKTLHLIVGTPQRGHRLLALYDALPENLQGQIQAEAVKHAPSYLRPGDVDGRFNFRDLITDLDNAFVEWRYQHENGGASRANIYPTILAMKALHEVSNTESERVLAGTG